MPQQSVGLRGAEGVVRRDELAVYHVMHTLEIVREQEEKGEIETSEAKLHNGIRQVVLSIRQEDRKSALRGIQRRHQ